MPSSSTNSLLLGFKPSVATRELERSPKDKTGHPHPITSVSAIAGLSNRSSNVASVLCIIIVCRTRPAVCRRGPPIGDGCEFSANERIVHIGTHLLSKLLNARGILVFYCSVDLEQANKIPPIRIKRLHVALLNLASCP